jgi:fructokinase
MKERREFFPAILLMPVNRDDRVKFVSTLFSSPVVAEVLSLFKPGLELCQRDLIRYLSHRSNKTVISVLKKLVSLGFLNEVVKVVEKSGRKVRMKCYNLTDLGKWYATIFKDPKDLDPATLHSFIRELMTIFLENYAKLVKRLGLRLGDLLQLTLENIVKSFTKKLYRVYDLVVFGSMAYDVFVSYGKVFSGGSGANVAYTASLLGLRTAFVTAIPLDLIGISMAIELHDNGVDLSLAKIVRDINTTICIIKHLNAYKPQINCLYNTEKPPVVTEITPEIINACREAKAIYLGEGIGKTFIELLKNLDRDSKIVVYRPNIHVFQYSDAFNEFLTILSYNPILILNEDKARILEERGVKVPQDLYKHGVKRIIVTLGSQEAELYIAPNTEPKQFPAPKTVVVDVVGAGDTFSAIFISRLLSEASFEEAIEYSVKVTACSLKELGPRKNRLKIEKCI